MVGYTKEVNQFLHRNHPMQSQVWRSIVGMDPGLTNFGYCYMSLDYQCQLHCQLHLLSPIDSADTPVSEIVLQSQLRLAENPIINWQVKNANVVLSEQPRVMPKNPTLGTKLFLVVSPLQVLNRSNFQWANPARMSEFYFPTVKWKSEYKKKKDATVAYAVQAAQALASIWPTTSNLLEALGSHIKRDDMADAMLIALYALAREVGYADKSAPAPDAFVQSIYNHLAARVQIAQAEANQQQQQQQQS